MSDIKTPLKSSLNIQINNLICEFNMTFQGDRGQPGQNGTQGHKGCQGKRGLKVAEVVINACYFFNSETWSCLIFTKKNLFCNLSQGREGYRGEMVSTEIFHVWLWCNGVNQAITDDKSATVKLNFFWLGKTG